MIVYRALKPAHGQGKPAATFNTQIAPTRPLVLPQLLNIVNSLDLCLLGIEGLSTLLRDSRADGAEWSSARVVGGKDVPAVARVSSVSAIAIAGSPSACRQP